MSEQKFYGLDALRIWLVQQGFRLAIEGMRSKHNRCNWYAYRRSEIETRRCECNDDKPGMQIVIHPSEMEMNGALHRGVEVELCGEFDGVWWKFMAYSIRPEEVSEKLGEVERRLIAAWEALK